MQNNKLLYLLYAYSALLVNVNFLDGSFKENNEHNLVWRINQITSMKIDDFYRVKCTILGEEVWFESNIPLKSSPEAFAGIFLLPALAKGATIHVKVPLDKEWLENIKEIIKVYHRWWGYPVRNPIIAYNIDTSFKQPVVSTGSCFSCGVDSFYTLLNDEQNIDYIVFSQGLDVSLLDNEKNMKILEVLNNICKNLNKKYIFLRTNIRNHSLIKSFD